MIEHLQPHDSKITIKVTQRSIFCSKIIVKLKLKLSTTLQNKGQTQKKQKQKNTPTIQLHVKSLLTIFFLKSIFTFLQFVMINCFCGGNAYVKASVHQTYIDQLHSISQELSTLYLILPFAQIISEINIKS